MRRVRMLLLAVVLLFSLALGVSGATGASRMGVYATVASDGSCQVTVTSTLHLEQGVSELYFPVPGAASDITINGSRAWAAASDGVRRLDLSGIVGNVVGDFTVTVNYTIQNVIERTEQDTLQLQLPLLSGFTYPVEAMEFSVTLPGVVEAVPAFSSGYHQTDIEKDMHYEVNGAIISGSFQQELKDHETLRMTLAVSDVMFPQAAVEIRNTDFAYIGILVVAGLALLYWLLFLRCLPPRRRYCPEPPEGYTAGELGCAISLQGVDLTMMVFSWAQLGYILIQIDRHGRVLLHKRMDMGNERGETEQRYFRKLFGKRQVIEASSYHYAELYRIAGKKPSGMQELMRRGSGNPKIFRALASGVGLFGGIVLGSVLSGDAALSGFMLVLITAAGAVSGWLIQGWCTSLFLRDKQTMWLGLGCCGAWLILGLAAQQFLLSLWIVAGLLLSGLMMAYGGRRTDWGRQTTSQVLGLRRYLRTVPKSELQRICSGNPDYFFTLAPYALALGSDKAFARRFGSLRLPGCPYLTSGMDAHMTAEEWSEVMRNTAKLMDARGKQLVTEKLLRLLGSFRK